MGGVPIGANRDPAFEDRFKIQFNILSQFLGGVPVLRHKHIGASFATTLNYH